MITIKVRCTCGNVRGNIRPIIARWGRRVVCMCRDCQAFARYLERERELLDGYGGTDILQLTPSQLVIDTGRDHLACVKLGPKGLLRWHTACCRTPVGNTVPTMQLPFVGMPVAFVEEKGDADVFGPVEYRINARSALRGPVKGAHDTAPTRLLFATLAHLAAARMKGQHLPSPFFAPSTGQPVCDPKVLSLKEREALSSPRE